MSLIVLAVTIVLLYYC